MTEELGLAELDSVAVYLKEHRNQVSEETVEFLLIEAEMGHVLPWMTIITRTKTSYRYARMGRHSAAMVGENLTGNTIEAHSTTRSAHLRHMCDRISGDRPMLINECVYRYSNGREATVDSLIARIRGRKAGESAIAVVSSPRLASAQWLRSMMFDRDQPVFKPRAIVGISETPLPD